MPPFANLLISCTINIDFPSRQYSFGIANVYSLVNSVLVVKCK